MTHVSKVAGSSLHHDLLRTPTQVDGSETKYSAIKKRFQVEVEVMFEPRQHH